MSAIRSPLGRARQGALRLLPCGGVIAALVFFAFLPASTIDSKAQTPGDSLYAVLWCGYSDKYVYVNDLEFAFQTLVNDYGYSKDNILVLIKWGGYYNLDDVGDNDCDFSATKANADTVFARLGRVMTNGDMLFFYATDHGYDEDTDCNDAGLCGVGDKESGNWISEEQLAGYLGGLDTPTRRIKKVVVTNTCSAGGMIPELGNLQAPFMIATASKACETSYYDAGDCDDAPTSCRYCAYSFWWFTAMHGSTPEGTAYNADANNDGYVTIEEASKFAKSNDEFAQEDAVPKEHPKYFDKNCISGKITTLGGTIPDLPAMIAFPYPCHGPLPCRWGGWACEGGVIGPFPASGAFGEAPGSRAQSAIRIEKASATSDTVWIAAEVCNGGDLPITSSVVSFYYADPTLSLVFPQSGLEEIGTRMVPFIAPHDTVLVGPLPFVQPSANSFGESYWTLLAVAEHYDSPVESGWLADDDHVAAVNRFELRAFPNEPETIHFSAQNPLSVPVKALLSLDDSELPPGWTAVLTPAPGDTVEIGPDSAVPVSLVMTGISGSILEGSVDIGMELNTVAAKPCESCDDSTCGGYIGEAGGCSVKLVVEGTIPVFAPELAAAVDGGAVTLTWRTPAGFPQYGFNVYRTEDESDVWVRLNREPLVGAGDLRFVDADVAPPAAYRYVLGILTTEGEVRSAPVEVALRPFVIELRQSYPNPFNPTTTITFFLPERALVTLDVYDVNGQRIARLEEGIVEAGVREYTWDGANDRGVRAGSGVYFCRLRANGRVLTQKVTLLK